MIVAQATEYNHRVTPTETEALREGSVPEVQSREGPFV